MFKIFLVGIGFTAAYFMAMAGDYISPLMFTGSMPELTLGGMALGVDALKTLYYVSMIVAVFGTVMTLISILGYAGNWFLNGWQNPNTKTFQISFLMLVFSAGMFGFGAVAKPFTLHGTSPLLWFGNSWWPALLFLLLPPGFLLANLFSEFAQWHLRPDLREDEFKQLSESSSRIEKQIQTLQSTVSVLLTALVGPQENGKWPMPKVAVNQKLVRLLDATGYDSADSTWEAPGSSVYEKMVMVLEGIGCTYDEKERKWNMPPANNLAEQIKNIHGRFDGLFAHLKRLEPAVPSKVIGNGVAEPHITDTTSSTAPAAN